MGSDEPIEGEPYEVAGVVTVPYLLFDMPATAGPGPSTDPEPVAEDRESDTEEVPASVRALPFPPAGHEAA